MVAMPPPITEPAATSCSGPTDGRLTMKRANAETAMAAKSQSRIGGEDRDDDRERDEQRVVSAVHGAAEGQPQGSGWRGETQDSRMTIRPVNAPRQRPSAQRCAERFSAGGLQAAGA